LDHAFVGVHTTGESVELKVTEARLTFFCVQESIESYPLKTSRTMRSISKAIPRKKVKQSKAADLCYAVADLNREFPNDDACPRLHKRTALAEWRHQVREMRRRTQALSRDRPYGLRLRSLRESHYTRSKGLCLRGAVLHSRRGFNVMYLMASTGCGITAKRIQTGDRRHLQNGLAHDTHLQPLIVNKQTATGALDHRDRHPK